MIYNMRCILSIYYTILPFADAFYCISLLLLYILAYMYFT